MRNLLAENQSVVKAQQTSIYILGWFSQILAIVAGAYAAGSWPGATVRFLFELIPWGEFIPAVLVIGFAGWFIDVVNDLTPNQVAITYGFIGPILAASDRTSGVLAERIRQWSEVMEDGVGGRVSDLAGDLSAGTLAILCMAVAVIVGRRVLAKQSQAAASAGRGGMR